MKYDKMSSNILERYRKNKKAPKLIGANKILNDKMSSNILENYFNGGSIS